MFCWCSLHGEHGKHYSCVRCLGRRWIRIKLPKNVLNWPNFSCIRVEYSSYVLWVGYHFRCIIHRTNRRYIALEALRSHFWLLKTSWFQDTVWAGKLQSGLSNIVDSSSFELIDADMVAALFNRFWHINPAELEGHNMIRNITGVIFELDANL